MSNEFDDVFDQKKRPPYFKIATAGAVSVCLVSALWISSSSVDSKDIVADTQDLPTLSQEAQENAKKQTFADIVNSRAKEIELPTRRGIELTEFQRIDVNFFNTVSEATYIAQNKCMNERGYESAEVPDVEPVMELMYNYVNLRPFGAESVNEVEVVRIHEELKNLGGGFEKLEPVSEGDENIDGYNLAMYGNLDAHSHGQLVEGSNSCESVAISYVHGSIEEAQEYYNMEEKIIKLKDEALVSTMSEAGPKEAAQEIEQCVVDKGFDDYVFYSSEYVTDFRTPEAEEASAECIESHENGMDVIYSALAENEEIVAKANSFDKFKKDYNSIKKNILSNAEKIISGEMEIDVREDSDGDSTSDASSDSTQDTEDVEDPNSSGTGGEITSTSKATFESTPDKTIESKEEVDELGTNDDDYVVDKDVEVIVIE